jgi:hypothetical protein
MLSFRRIWLDPSEQKELVSMMLEFQLIMFSNGRDLPLKERGQDGRLYQFKDARNHPQQYALTHAPLRIRSAACLLTGLSKFRTQ